MIPDCGRTIVTPGGHTPGCGVCPACIEAEKQERLAEDRQIQEDGCKDLEIDRLRRNAKHFIGIFTGPDKDFVLARYAEIGAM